MAESVKEFKERLINNLGHLIAGIHCEGLQNTRIRLDGLYNEVDEYLARTGHVRRELFATSPKLPRGGLFTSQQAENHRECPGKHTEEPDPDQQIRQWLSGLNSCISDEVDAGGPLNHPSEEVYLPVYSPISDASTESADTYILSDPEDSHQVLSDPEDLSQQIATDIPINMMECDNPYNAMLMNYANEWGFSLNQ